MTAAINDLLEYALGLAGKVDKPYSRSFNYIEIAGVYLDYGQKSRCLDILAEGLKTIELLKRPEEKSDRLAWAGRVYALAGDSLNARESLSRAVLLAGASAPAEVANGLYRAVCEYLDAGMKENAEKTIQQLYNAVLTLENDTDKALELINISDIYRELDQSEKAQDILSQALNISLTLKDSWFKAERLIDAAGEYLDIGLKDKAVSVIRDAVAATGSTGEENQPYFLLKIVDLYIAAEETSKALGIVAGMMDIVKTDESAYSKSKITLETAEKYHQLGRTEEAVRLTLHALDILQPVEELEDKISGFVEIARFLGTLSLPSSSPSTGEPVPYPVPHFSRDLVEQLKVRVTPRDKALELAGQAFELCDKVPDKKTRIYLLGALTLLFAQLEENQKAEQSVAEILKISKESTVKNQGSGTVVMDLAAAGKFVPALQLVRVIHDPNIKSSAIANIAKNLIISNREPSEQISELIKEATA